MSKPGKYKSLAESLAEVENRKLRDFDPEGFGTAFENDKAKYDDDESESSVDEDAGRAHYFNVPKSKLRKPEEVDLGKEYTGAKVSRENVFGEDDDDVSAEDEDGDEEGEDEMSEESEEEFGDLDGADEEIDSNEAFGEDDEDKFKDFTFRGSKKVQNGGERHVDGIEDLDLDDEDDDSEEMDGADDDSEEMDGLSNEDKDSNNDQDDSDESEEEVPRYPSRNTNSELESAETRAKLRELMATEQQNVVGNLAQAVKDDALKGQAVKKQRGIFDTFLNTRIRLQKALIAANTLALPSTTNENVNGRDHIDAAEQAALNLYNSMTELRSALDGKTKKRSFHATQSTSLSEIEAHLSSLEEPAKQRRRTTIAKWAEKTAPIATIDPRNKLIKPSSTSLLDILDVQLMEPSLDRLRKRTRTARSCAPAHLEAGIAESTEIYDDADWYALLLRELVETKMAGSNTASLGLSVNGGAGMKLSNLTSLQRATKTKKPGLDVKASKGRKLKFNVHEKLLNFMAPEDRGTWGDRQVEEFFGSLLGRRVRGGLGEDDVDSEEDVGESALRLFRT